MKVISLPGIAIEIPIIGFGCSALSGTSKRDSLHLLETAFDAGVRHFDVARYYGYGEAERLLGTFLKSHRSEVTITTKFGIDPPQRTNALRIAMNTGRQIARMIPATRTFMRRQAQGLVKGGKFSAKDAQANLEISLRELSTDYIDFYLLHDYTVSETPPDELLAFLARSVKAGTIRYFGVGTGIEDVLRVLQSQPELGRIVQFENSVLKRNLEQLPCRTVERFVITHGALSVSYRSLLSFLKLHRELVRNWSALLNIDCSSEDSISALMLNYAAHANSDGLVLFSSKSASRVNKNVNAVLEPVLSTEQIALFEQLVEKDVTPFDAVGA